MGQKCDSNKRARTNAKVENETENGFLSQKNSYAAVAVTLLTSIWRKEDSKKLREQGDIIRNTNNPFLH